MGALRTAVSQFFSNINSLQPAADYFVGESITDPFYQQIVYILKGEARVSDKRLAEPGSLDLIWLMLLTYKLLLG